MGPLEERVKNYFEAADDAKEFLSENVPPTADKTLTAVERTEVEMFAQFGAIKRALVEIAAEIDKLSASKPNV